MKIEDEIPAGLEYVKDSLEAVGDKPVPTEFKVENGKVTAEVSRNYGYERKKYHL